MASPYVMKAKDGATYLQLQVGNSIVYVRTSASNVYDGVSQRAIAVYSKACKTVSYYTDPIIEKVVAMYRKFQLKMMNMPLVVKAKKALIDTKVAILDVTARVRVRAVEAG